MTIKTISFVRGLSRTPWLFPPRYLTTRFSQIILQTFRFVILLAGAPSEFLIFFYRKWDIRVLFVRAPLWFPEKHLQTIGQLFLSHGFHEFGGMHKSDWELILDLGELVLDSLLGHASRCVGTRYSGADGWSSGGGTRFSQIPWSIVIVGFKLSKHRNTFV